MKLTVNVPGAPYDIQLGRGLLDRVGEFVSLDRKVLLVTDEGVPLSYTDRILAQCPQGHRVVVQQGEGAKSFSVYESLCKKLLEENFSRKDCVIAVGGGVMGDLAGFVAATYMRGIDFVNIPTTTLAQIDSSIGGKVAVNLEGVKNIVGAFYQPKAVLIDFDTLDTLPSRHYNNGLVEAVKAGLIYDETLFQLFERQDPREQIEEIVYRSLLVKKAVVEQDEKEQGLRKILNFGHTIGHGVESLYGLSGLLHGECVAIGMFPMLEGEDLRRRLKMVCDKLQIPTQAQVDPHRLLEVMQKDKKATGDSITVVKVGEAGKARLEQLTMAQLEDLVRRELA